MRERMEELKNSYLPQWRAHGEERDIGTELADLFIKLMEENAGEYIACRRRISMKLPELLGISFKSARPSMGLIRVNITDGAGGIWLNAGTKLYGGTEDGERAIFETKRRLYMTDSVVTDIFAEQGVYGKIRPIAGQVYEDMQSREIYAREEVVIRHPYILTGKGQIYTLEAESGELALEIERGALEICYLTESGFIPAEKVKVIRNTVLFEMRLPRVREDIIIIRKKGTLTKPVRVGRVLLSSAASPCGAASVKNPIMDCDPQKFLPFGTGFSLYDECILEQDAVFTKSNALITMEFQLSFERKATDIESKTEEKLPLIRYQRKYEQKQTVKESFVDGIAMEYNSIKGWKRLEPVEDVEYIETIFAGDEEGKRIISFRCPKDWGNEEEDGRHLLRFRIISADHCYEQPCIFHVPVIQNLRLSYTYEKACEPESITGICGIFEHELKGEGSRTWFAAENGGEDIYIRLDRKIEEGPVSFYIQCDNQPVEADGITLLYAGSRGFKELVRDDTGTESHRMGVFTFVPPEDMIKTRYCGMEGYYIRILHKNPAYMGKDWSVIPNVTEIWNVDTGIAEDYYVDEIAPGMSVTLHDRDIWNIDLWMDETREYLESRKKESEFAKNREIKIEKNEPGGIERVLVLWEETDTFGKVPEDGRAYVLDRQKRAVIFGDGKECRLPAEKERSAFQALIRKCPGAKGNRKEEEITQTVSNLLFLDSLSNITPILGGRNRETEQEREKRAEALFGDHGRLITADDYCREVKNFFPGPDKVNVKIEAGRVYMAILTDDFDVMVPELKKHILDLTEAGLKEEELIPVKPVPAKISVELWYKAHRGTDSSFVRQRFYEIMEEYLNPITGNEGRGWELGKLPYKSRLLMQLNSLKEWGTPAGLSATVSYESMGEKKECSLDMAKPDFAMIVTKGNLKIHIINT